jgi:hypothetical protein
MSAKFQSSAVLYSHNGITDSIGGWSRRCGLNRKTLEARLSRKGWTLERVLTTPPIPKTAKRGPRK